MQLNTAVPTAGKLLSVAVAVEPDPWAGSIAEQLLAPTVQDSVADGHEAGVGTVQLAFAALLQLPLLQLKLAVPMLGCVPSVAVVIAPETMVGIVAVQVLAPSDQLTVLAEHAAATTCALQLVPVADPQVPLLQLNVAEPVVGCELSVAVVLEPELVLDTEAVQVFGPTDQDNVVAAHEAGVGVVELWQW